MSPDELVVQLIGGSIALFLWGDWYLGPLRVERLGAPWRGRALLLLTPVLAAAVLLAVLLTVSAQDVRDDPTYLGFYMVVGAAWVGGWSRLLPLLGLSVRDDVVERGNRAAAIAIAGAIAAIALCYAGGNVGNGPGWWVVIFSAAIATGALFALWLVFDLLTGLSDTITVDRDEAAGVRLGGFLVGSALVLGRAVAGDWISAPSTLRDFVTAGWPALLLLAVGAMLERSARPTPARPAPALATFGVLPALAYIAAGVVAVLAAGPAW